MRILRTLKRIMTAWPHHKWDLDCLTAHTWLHYVQYTRTKPKHLDCCYQVWKLSLTAWPTPKKQTPWPLLEPGRSYDYSTYGNDHRLWCAGSENLWALGDHFFISLSQNFWLLQSKLRSTILVPSEHGLYMVILRQCSDQWDSANTIAMF